MSSLINGRFNSLEALVRNAASALPKKLRYRKPPVVR